MKIKGKFLSIKLIFKLFCAFVMFIFTVPVWAQDPIMHWDFEENTKKGSIEVTSGVADVLEGHFMVTQGIKGKGIKFDGFTTCLRRCSEDKKMPGDELTLEAWVALGNYPWNWCPIITTESDKVEGYRLMLGPLGQISLQGAIEEQWISCTSEQEVIPLRTWMHLVGVYKANKEMALYLNGKLVACVPINGKIQYSPGSECRLGMVAKPGKPSDIHRTWGTVPAYYGIDGIMDEIMVYDKSLSKEQVINRYKSVSLKEADMAPRKLPKIKNQPERFGAFYTKLEYYPGWDNLWPVEQDPDVVVCFDKSPVKLIFWRGIRYGASWVSENENWMTDQSVEAWEHGEEDKEGCFEHMQDRHCRFSHVRVIENTDARVVVHWRYAPVSAYNHTWRPDPKTGWECWVDEYYYIYPDATGIRRVSWKKGTLGYPRQFQESLALLHPGQKISDLLEKDFAFIADYDRPRKKMMFVDDPNHPPYGPFSWDDPLDYTIQQYNFKSQNKPFICFEPGNKMFVRHRSIDSYDRAGGCNHFPVGQARCDGRTTRMSDRPSHCSSFPISEPVIHEENHRYYWCGLYGMNTMDMDQLVSFGRSWAFAPELLITSKGVVSNGFDRSRRCYQIQNNTEKPLDLHFTVNASKDSPVHNPAFFIKNWNAGESEILVNGKKFKDYRIGINHELEGTDLVLFLWIQSADKINVSIRPID